MLHESIIADCPKWGAFSERNEDGSVCVYWMRASVADPTLATIDKVADATGIDSELFFETHYRTPYGSHRPVVCLHIPAEINA